MSSLLEQAIIDATSLKEAALKNAEGAILEKYSIEVKEALSSILDPTLETLTEADASFIGEVPFGHEGEDLDGLAEDDLVEIDFDDLKARLHAEEDAGVEATADEMFSHEETASDLLAMPEEPMMPPPPQAEMPPDMGGGAPPMELEENLGLTEEMLEALAEELTVDIAPHFNISGWSSVNAADERADERAVEEAAVAQQSEEVTEEKEKYLKLYESKVYALSTEVQDLKGLLREAKVQLNHLILENAKLVYQNKALNSSSLNERQKKKIVEAVYHANTVEEAKKLFEALQGAVGISAGRRKNTESLREAVSRPSTSMLLGARKSETPTADPTMDRMLRLAGIK